MFLGVQPAVHRKPGCPEKLRTRTSGTGVGSFMYLSFIILFLIVYLSFIVCGRKGSLEVGGKGRHCS